MSQLRRSFSALVTASAFAATPVLAQNASNPIVPDLKSADPAAPAASSATPEPEKAADTKSADAKPAEPPATPVTEVKPADQAPKPGEENFLPPWVHTSDFVDTRLTFLFADENILANPGETTPNAPGPRIAGGGIGNQFNQFYDNFNTRYTGFETLSNLVLYKKSKTWIDGLDAEAALTLTLLVLAEKNNSLTQSTALQDASSYIKLNYLPKGWDASKKEGITFTAFPMSADRMRLGYAYKISWGGSNTFPNQGASVPGAKLQVNKGKFYGFVGAKTTIVFNELLKEQETNYGFLAGAGFDILDTLRLEANGGYFQKGVNPEPQVLGQPVRARGASAQLVYHVGQAVGSSIDFALYKNDPNKYINFFKPETYPGGLTYTIALEGSFLQQTLANPDKFGETSLQNATASALQARFKYEKLRFNVLGLFRSLSFIQFNVPGFPPFFDFPAGTTQSPEMFFAAGADYYIEKLHLTPGIIAGVQRPASFSTNGVLGGNNPPASVSGKRTVVVTDTNQFTVLPTGDDATNVLSVKGNVRLQLSDEIAAVGEAYFNYNANRTTFKDDSFGVSQPTYERPTIIGYNLVLQARF